MIDYSNQLIIYSLQIRVRLPDPGAGHGVAPCEETISHVGALRGDRLVVGERIGHIPKSERQVPQA